ncbi:MAG: hypothetical protein ACK5CE_08775 [Actinomycetes bacterium]|jgi:hypothetical protein
MTENTATRFRAFLEAVALHEPSADDRALSVFPGFVENWSMLKGFGPSDPSEAFARAGRIARLLDRSISLAENGQAFGWCSEHLQASGDGDAAAAIPHDVEP